MVHDGLVTQKVEPFWLKPFWLKSLHIAHACAEVCVEDFFCRSVGDMPRRGWSAVDVPAGWVQVLRGRRPPAEKWPTVQRGVGRWRQEKSSKSSPPKRNSVPLPEHKPSRAPESAFADAVDEVKRLEAAIEVLGGDNVHTKGLQAALRVTRAGVERVEACKLFLE